MSGKGAQKKLFQFRPRNLKKTTTRPRASTYSKTSLQRQETPLQASLHKHNPKNPTAKRLPNLHNARGEKWTTHLLMARMMRTVAGTTLRPSAKQLVCST